MLGLKFATDGKKFMPFRLQFSEMLGLQVDLVRLAERKEMLIGHTEDRKNELKQKIDETLAAGSHGFERMQSASGEGWSSSKATLSAVWPTQR